MTATTHTSPIRNGYRLRLGVIGLAVAATTLLAGTIVAPAANATTSTSHVTALTESHAPKTVKKGGTDKLYVRLTDKTAKKGLGNTKVWLQERLPKTIKVKGKTVTTKVWTNVKSVTTNTNGKASLTVKPTTTHAYRWDRHAFTKAGVSYKAVATASFTITVKASGSTSTPPAQHSSGNGGGLTQAQKNAQTLIEDANRFAKEHGWSPSQVHCTFTPDWATSCSTPNGVYTAG